MNKDLQVILVLLLITAIIISTIFASIAIYDYYKNENIKNQIRNQELIDNCIPGEYRGEKSTGLIQNETHIFHPQTCSWHLAVNNFTAFMMPKS